MTPLSIAFVTQDDPFYVRVFFEEFMDIRDRSDAIKAVVIAPAMGKKSFLALLRQMYDFYGPWNFLQVGVRYVFYRLASKLPAWARRGRFFSVDQICRHHGIRATYARNINAPEFLAHVAQWDLDLLISVAAPQVFREPLIGLPRLGCINIHNSKLPKYRGMLPNFWQMFHGEKTVGTTIHRINAGIDDGEILMQEETLIHAGEDLDSLIRRTKVLGARFMVEMLRRFRTNEVRALPNPKEEATYFTFPTRRDVAEFRKRGFRLI
jgi:methionyl-tRNA formyltransferase